MYHIQDGDASDKDGGCRKDGTYQTFMACPVDEGPFRVLQLSCIVICGVMESPFTSRRRDKKLPVTTKLKM